jgi:hypothetical protein
VQRQLKFLHGVAFSGGCLEEIRPSRQPQAQQISVAECAERAAAILCADKIDFHKK